MTVRPPVESLIQGVRNMEEALSGVQGQAKAVPTHPLLITQQRTLKSALQIAIAAKREEIRKLLEGYQDWYINNARHYTTIEATANGYANELLNLTSGVTSLQDMQTTVDKLHLAEKSRA